MLVEDIKDSNGKLIGRKSTGYVLGLTGQWGLGKSTVVQFLHEKLSTRAHTISVLFNPWVFSGRDELFDGFFNGIRDAVGKSDLENAREIVLLLEKYWKALSKAGSPLGDIADSASGSWPAISILKHLVDFAFLTFGGERSPSVHERKAKLEKKIASSNLAIVVLVDELDRVERREVRAVAQLVKAIGEVKGISYLVAYDEERVIDALGHGDGPERQKRGSHYLEKIIQYPIPLRPLFIEDVERLLSKILDGADFFNPETRTDEQNQIFSWVIRNAKTPRDIKRLIGTFEVLIRPLRHEVCEYDVLGYSWLTTKAPMVRKWLANNIDSVVDDPTEVEAIRRAGRDYEQKPRLTPTELIGDEAQPVSELLSLMFPIFGEDRSSLSLNAFRISRRQNLVRTLYLGNPRNLISRQQVFEIWNVENIEDMKRALLSYREEGLLPALIDRIHDYIGDLPEAQDKVFWPSVTQILVRSDDWADGPSDARGLIEDLSAVVFLISRISNTGKMRAKSILNLLIEENELLLTPYVFRRHLFRFGMTKHDQSGRPGDTIWTREELDALRNSEVSRYSEALSSGYALRRLPSLDIMYAVGNLSQWNAQLKSQLSAQMKNPEAIKTFASLSTSPGLSIDKSSLEEFLDTEMLIGVLRDLGPLENWIHDTWTQLSVKRFVAALEGKDPIFVTLKDDDYTA